MVSTRSRTAQTHLEDFATKHSNHTSKQEPASPKKTAPKANISRKRKSTDSDIKEEEQTPKRTKTSTAKPLKSKAESAGDKDNDVVIINRAPVLHLWAASVAHLTHPELSWETCLSAGSAISTICAVAKGRSIGAVAEKDDDAGSEKKKKKGELVEVMHFKLEIRDGLAVVGGDSKGKPANEEGLRRKFAEGEYEKVKRVFEEVLKSWKREEEELNKKAFHMYEEFRPDVSKGQKGWGRKGELRLQTVRNAVRTK